MPPKILCISCHEKRISMPWNTLDNLFCFFVLETEVPSFSQSHGYNIGSGKILIRVISDMLVPVCIFVEETRVKRYSSFTAQTISELLNAFWPWRQRQRKSRVVMHKAFVATCINPSWLRILFAKDRYIVLLPGKVLNLFPAIVS